MALDVRIDIRNRFPKPPFGAARQHGRRADGRYPKGNQLIVEGKEYRRINSRRLAPGETLKIPGRWDAMREMVAFESKSKRRFILAVGVIGLIAGMAGAFVLDHIILTDESVAAAPVEQNSAAAPVGQDPVTAPVGQDLATTAVSQDSIAPTTTDDQVTAKNNTVGAGETPRSTEAELGLASDGRCRKTLSGDNYSINCFQRGDDDGAPDKTLDIFQDLIKLKKYDCDESIKAASYMDDQKNKIFLVQCGQSDRYRVEIIGENIKIYPVQVD